MTRFLLGWGVSDGMTVGEAGTVFPTTSQSEDILSVKVLLAPLALVAGPLIGDSGLGRGALFFLPLLPGMIVTVGLGNTCVGSIPLLENRRMIKIILNSLWIIHSPRHHTSEHSQQ